MKTNSDQAKDKEKVDGDENAAKTKKSKLSKAEMFRALKFLGFSISAGVIQLGSFELLYHAINWYWWPSYLISVV